MEKKNFALNVQLDKDFVGTLNFLIEKYGEELAKLNGFAPDQLNYTGFIDNFIDHQTVADASIDGNANVGTKDICSLTSEMHKPHSKLLSFNKIYYEMKKEFGKDRADEFLTSEYIGDFYLHDAYSSTQVSYCFAYDLESLVNKGLYFVDNFNAQPPKHLTTFTDFVGEFVSYVSNRTSGACGLPSFLVYSYYFWRKDCEEGYYIMNPEYYRDQEFQRITFKLNQPYLRVNQSAFTNFTIMDESYLESIFGGKQFPDGSYMIDSIADIVEYEKAFMEVVSKIREQNVMTFPVLTYSLLRKNGKFVNEDFAKWCCKHNMKWADSNFFISEDVTSLSNCCRLVSDIKNLGYFNSLGGTALEVGSVKVNTINLARIAYESKTIEEYKGKLKDKVLLCLDTLDRIRHIIQRNIEKGLLPNYTYELIHINSQYNTIGIIGYYEAIQKFGYTYKDDFGYTYYTDEGLKFLKDILAEINSVKDEYASHTNYSINVEAIPGERCAAVLMEKDKLFFPNEKYELPLYGNQWIPLGVKTTLKEKVTLSAALDKACNGGSIAHINLDTPFADFDTAWKMLNYVADAGVVYFAFCTRISACESNHGFYGDVCPICGKPKVTTYQRVVGFLTPEKTYSKERKEEFKMRDWMELNRMEDLQ